MCCCDDNPPSVYNHETIKRARKAHKCYECRRAIEAGEPYDYFSGIWDGEFQSYKWCSHCVAAQAVFEALTNDHCFCFGSLWEGINDYRSEVDLIDPRVLRLIAGADRKWRHRRGPKKGQLMPVPAIPERQGVVA